MVPTEGASSVQIGQRFSVNAATMARQTLGKESRRKLFGSLPCGRPEALLVGLAG